MAADGSLHLKFIGSTNVCTPADDREVWDRIAPGSPIVGYLGAASADVDWQTPTKWNSSGMYIAPESGYVLDIADDGRYRYYEDVTERRLAATCSGQRLPGTVEIGRTPGVDGYLYDAVVMRLTTTEAGCASTVADQGPWVMLGSSAE